MPMSVHTREFWKVHPDAYNINMEAGKNQSVYTAEIAICAFITDLKVRMPVFYLVSDSPTNDISLLDNILARHNHPSMSCRHLTMFYQPICTWSYRLAIANLVNVKPRKLITTFAHLIRSREIEKHTSNGKSFGPPHTVLSDCYHIMIHHFKIMDIAEKWRKNV